MIRKAKAVWRGTGRAGEGHLSSDSGVLADNAPSKWWNQSLARVNDCVVRLGVFEGEFHWHKHDREDEYFHVVEGRLFIDLDPVGGADAAARDGVASVSWRMTEHLVKNGRIGCVPGVDFGAHGEGYVRFCFARDRKELTGALQSLKALLGVTVSRR